MAIAKIMGEENEYGIYLPTGQEDLGLFRFDVPEKIISLVSQIGVAHRIEKANLDQLLNDFHFIKRKELDENAKRELLRQLGATGSFLFNGARFYVDMSHPEYSTPECRSLKDLVAANKAGEVIMERGRKLAQEAIGTPIKIHKDNSDRQGNSFASHENYLVLPQTFKKIISSRKKEGRQLISFLVARPLICGAGKVGSEHPEFPAEFQLSQRADFIQHGWNPATGVGMRGIINQRDIPYADPKRFRRLHLIMGDANLCEVAQYLKFGMTEIFLKMLEDGFVSKEKSILNISIKKPVLALQKVSRDYHLKESIRLVNGQKVSALNILEEFLRLARKYLLEVAEPSLEEEEVLEILEFCILNLRNNPQKLFGYLDWVTKLAMIEEAKESHNYSWDDLTLRRIDFSYHDIDPQRSVFQKLIRSGMIKRVLTDEEIERAVFQAPNTRASLRAGILKKFPSHFRNGSWTFLSLMDWNKVIRIRMLNPLIEGNLYRDQIENCSSLSDLYHLLEGEKDISLDSIRLT